MLVQFLSAPIPMSGISVSKSGGLRCPGPGVVLEQRCLQDEIGPEKGPVKVDFLTFPLHARHTYHHLFPMITVVISALGDDAWPSEPGRCGGYLSYLGSGGSRREQMPKHASRS